MQKLTKELVSRIQIETAVRMYFETNYVAAITLAGAAEEILGKLVEDAGGQSAFASLRQATVDLHQRLYGEPLEHKVVADRANAARNSLKHLRTSMGESVEFDPVEEASHMLSRAIANYWSFTTTLTPAMERFERERSDK